MNNARLITGGLIILAVLGVFVFMKEDVHINSKYLTGKLSFTGLFGASTSVEIVEQSEAIMYEENRRDSVFEIDSSLGNGQLSYNGSYGGQQAGFDSFDNQTQLFTLENAGNTRVDVVISAQDFTLGTTQVDVGFDSDKFQIYIPGVGWENIPDNSMSDFDGRKDGVELCIADSLEIGKNITGFDFRAKGMGVGKYKEFVRVTSYDPDFANPCNAPGDYADPGKLRW